tara:strand:- start:2817 stop:3041 length:225 start_codon:yes stop_codon:yes gene_type:complete
MSVTKQEAVFLKEILARHLEDFVEELVREEKNPDRAMQHMKENRLAGKELLVKAEETIRRASRATDTPHFTNLK